MISPIHAMVICPIHGHIGLDRKEFDRQLNIVGSWHCSVCGASAHLDHDDFDERHDLSNPPEVQEPPPF